MLVADGDFLISLVVEVISCSVVIADSCTHKLQISLHLKLFPLLLFKIFKFPLLSYLFGFSKLFLWSKKTLAQ